MNKTNAPRTIAKIVATVKSNLANGTAVLGATLYDNNGAPIDLSGRRPAQADSTAKFHQQFPCRQDYLRKHCRHGCAACEDAPEPTNDEQLHADDFAAFGPAGIGWENVNMGESDPLSDTDLPFADIDDDWQDDDAHDSHGYDPAYDD